MLNGIRTETYEGREALTARASKLLYFNDFKGNPDHLRRYLQTYLDVTPDGIQAAAQKYLRADQRLLITFTPNEKAPIQGRLLVP